ncbi:sensor histidine kinase [Actinoallomurus sp. CA-150999]|uniref:sensor histidine kinase n=1 Tax=Actinoallomurus sp. CA-150999 TaxID=3239887 RepID=UPI003D8EDF2D
MTARTSYPPPTRMIEPESLMGHTRLGAAEHRTVVKLLLWLTRVRQKDQAHPSVRRWGVPGVCVLLGVPSLADAAYGSGPGFAVVLALCVAGALPLVWRRQWPVPVYLIVSAVTAAALPIGAVIPGVGAARLAALFNVARFGTPAQLIVCAAINLVQTAVSGVFFWTSESERAISQATILSFLSVTAVLLISALGMAGKLVNAYVAALEEHAVHLEEDRDQRARLAAATERARISREMHDILGHTLAVIVTLADGASGLAEAKPKRGAETLRIIADSGRGALGELTRLLSVIDDPGDSDAAGSGSPLAPQPGLSDLDGLLERARTAGRSATLYAEGGLTRLGEGLQLAVYRIVQESLTNALKHAAADTTVAVSVIADGDLVRVTVEDTGPPATAKTGRGGPGSGHGLVGMRERAALYDGSLDAGPNDRGGWTVRALLTATPPPTAAATTTEKHPA